jgi:glycosyltransferase involved in cell wall biosynthesis
VLNYLTFGPASLLALALSRPADWVVVEYPTLFGALPAVWWCRLRGRRVVVNVADLWLDAVVGMGGISSTLVADVLRRLERWMLLHADVVATVTDGYREELIAKGVDPARLAWLPNGADTTLFAPAPSDPSYRASLGVGEGDHLVLYAGTHGYVHRLEVVLEAAALLRSEPVVFLLVGGGSEKESLRRLSASMGLENVVFRDPVPPEEVARMLREADIGLASVRAGDAFRTIRSAKMWPTMASGRPVVYSGDDEGSRLVASIGAGVVTPAEDAGALAGAILDLVRDPGRAAELGEHGRAWVEENASWRLLVGRWLQRLGEVVRHQGPRDVAAADGGCPA